MEELINKLILELSNENTLEGAEEHFESIRHIEFIPKSREVFEEIHKCQLAVLFRIKRDLNKEIKQ